MSNNVNMNLLNSLELQVDDRGFTHMAPSMETGWRVLPYAVLCCMQAEPGYGAFRGSICHLEGKSYEISNGDVVFIPRNTRHRILNPDIPIVSAWVQLDVTLPPDLDFFSLFEVPLFMDREKFPRFFELTRQFDEVPATDLNHLIREKSLIFQLLELILAQSTLKEQYRDFAPGYSDFFPLLDWMDRRRKYRFSLDEAAREMKCSKSKLQKDFKRVFGVPIGEYALRSRLRNAAKLLVNSGMSCAEIARATGFADQFAFSKAFRRAFGLSPRDYRSASEHKGIVPVNSRN